MNGHTCYTCKLDKHKTHGEWHPVYKLPERVEASEVSIPGLMRWVCHRCWRRENGLYN